MNQQIIKVWNIGKSSFNQGIKIQKLAQRVLERGISLPCNKNISGILIIIEHETPVYTVGLRKYRQGETSEKDAKQGLTIDKNKLIALGAEFQETNRGGIITYHGPGQLVAYPIINLRKYFDLGFPPTHPQINTFTSTTLKDVGLDNIKINTIKWYVQKLADTLTLTSSLLGVRNVISQITPSALTGSWYMQQKPKVIKPTPENSLEILRNFFENHPQKIGAIGVRYSKDTTSHGIALNCDVDLSWYNYIDPCGLYSHLSQSSGDCFKHENVKLVTSISEVMKYKVSVSQVIPYFLDAFAQTFVCELREDSQYLETDTDIIMSSHY